MKAIVTAPCNINGEPRQVGDAVEVDPNTFANLVLKGKLGPVDEEEQAPVVEDRDPEVVSRKPKLKTRKH